MIISRVARRYAEAVYDSVPAELGVEGFLRDLADLRSSLKQSRELQVFFHSPVVSFAKKSLIIETLFRDAVHPYTYGVLRFLLHKRREPLLMEMIEAVVELHRVRSGIVTATVTTAADIRPEQAASVEAVLQDLAKARVETTYKTDESIRGGMIVRIGDLVYDGSVARGLARLRELLVA
jgi:F-type H+-transporting ATPase subunit delta